MSECTPTEELVLDVLAARKRAGDSTWTFTTRIAPTLAILASKELIDFKSGSAPKTCLAWLTKKGEKAVLLDDYKSNADRKVEELQELLRELRTEAERFMILTTLGPGPLAVAIQKVEHSGLLDD